MDDTWKQAVSQQFGAAIRMLENAVLACPDDLWGDPDAQPPPWYLTYHTLFWLDLYLSGSVEGFAPPAPFTLGELEPDVLPERVYAKDELLRYLRHCRRKCGETIDALDAEGAARRCVFRWGEPSFAELLLYNLRHVQHGAAQLNLLLRRATDSAPPWVGRAAVRRSGG